MTRDEKRLLVEGLVEELKHYPHFYLVDISGLNAKETSDLRSLCFKSEVKLSVVKNTLFSKALLSAESPLYDELSTVLKGSTGVMFSESSSAPAKLIKEFRKKCSKPLLKAAYVEESLYMGDDQLSVLSALKSREELIADVICLLQSPARNVLSALQSGGQTIVGVLKTLSERASA